MKENSRRGMDTQMSEDGRYMCGSFELPAEALIARYLRHVQNGDVDSCPDYRVMKDFSCESNPFITILTRTQGNRIEALQETLLCLTGQSDTDFELIIVGHNIQEAQCRAVLELIDEQPAWLCNRIRFVTAEGGSRARPLNVGFSIARSDYVTILDDDDIVFDNWIGSFHEAAGKAFGSILFSYVFTQEWESTVCPDGTKKLHAVGSPVPDYCKGFDIFDEVSINSCPTMGLAFPLFVFRDIGLRFDETLTTTEDWDFLMRAAFICGVVDTPTPVAIYRLWQNAKNSHAIHDEGEWERNRIRIQRKFIDSPILLPEGAAETLIYHSEGLALCVKADMPGTRLLFDTGDGFSEESALLPEPLIYDMDSQTNTVSFTGLETLGPLKSVHIIVCDRGMITVEDPKITLTYADGHEDVLALEQVRHNGISAEAGIASFISGNPRFWVGMKRPRILSRADIEFKLRPGVREDLLTGTKLVVRAKEKLRRMSRRFTR